MSRSGEISFRWGDGPHVFRLTIGGWRELQDKLGVGPYELLMRMREGRWKVDDAHEILRVSLIGGEGVDPIEALTLVERYVDDRPLKEWIEPALKVLNAAMFGLSDKEKKRRKKKAPSQPRTETDSASPPSTATVQ